MPLNPTWRIAVLNYLQDPVTPTSLIDLTLWAASVGAPVTWNNWLGVHVTVPGETTREPTYPFFSYGTYTKAILAQAVAISGGHGLTNVLAAGGTPTHFWHTLNATVRAYPTGGTGGPRTPNTKFFPIKLYEYLLTHTAVKTTLPKTPGTVTTPSTTGFGTSPGDKLAILMWTELRTWVNTTTGELYTALTDLIKAANAL